MNKTVVTDLVVIGAGPSGYSAAFRASDLGIKTILIEQNSSLGGVCLNHGCIPSKALLHIAKILKEVKDFSNLGIFKKNINIDIKKISDWKKKLINKMSSGLQHLSYLKKVKIISGRAKFLNKNEIFIYEKNNIKKYTIQFKNCIIATGSLSRTLSFVPKQKKYVWDSKEALKLYKIPKKMLIVGAGVVGLEMATIYESFGSKVDILENSSRILPISDTDISKLYYNSVKNRFHFKFNSFLKNVSIKNNYVYADIKNEKGCFTNKYNTLLLSIGRVPNIKNINLEVLNLNFKNGYIKVDKQCKTNVSNIYAIGDVSGPPMLAHKGIYEAHIAAEVIFGKNHFFDTTLIPTVSYTDPEVAWVGITEKIAIQNNINYEVASFPWSISGRALATNSTQGVTKLIFDKNTKKIIGGAVVGNSAGELLGEISLAIEMGCHVSDISLTMHAHPTLCESINSASKIFERTSTDLLNKK